jgi:Phosphotransferase enzyme family
VAVRSRILWVGEPPPNGLRESLDRLQLSLKLTAVDALTNEWPWARAVVFSVSQPGSPLLQNIESALAAAALTEGLRAYVVAPLEHVPVLNRRLSALPYGGRIALRDSRTLTNILAECASCLPGPSRSTTLTLSGCDDCDSEDIVLLRRGFSDCTEVRFSTLIGGRSAATFQAFARLQDSKAGPYPLPFFVKLDRYGKIKREIENYQDCTALFIPFYARPNIDLNRCVLGAERGLIVGNFVEHSDSLRELVERGTAQAAINSLFEDALRGWRTQAYVGHGSPWHAPLARSLGGGAIKQFSPRARNRADAYAREAAALGASLTATEIGQMLDELLPIPHRIALCHGDLHGDNIRVRAGHAILIDFAAVERGPLVADPAALETALVLRASAHESDWSTVASELYGIEHLEALPAPREPSAPLSALWNSVRQIRRFGLAEQLTRQEYATAAAVYLLRHGLHDRDPGEQGIRRPTLVWLAERLARSIKTSSTTNR